ncbi:MAG: formyltransferase family protein [Hansschlegelia sp.]
MRLAILGRTELLVATARRLIAEGHSIGLVVTSGDMMAEAPFHSLAVACGAAFIETARINSLEIINAMKAAACEVAVSLNWRTLIKPAALSCFARGVLNGHAGDLPRYRGNACPNWAILKSEPHVGLCVHQMSAGLDAGPIYARAQLPLTDDTYVTDVQHWIDGTLPGLFSASIAAILRGEQPVAQEQDPAASLRCYPRRPSDARIDWQDDAHEVRRLIRASSRPFDGAFCFFEDRQLTIWRADVVEPVSGHLAMPGQPCEPFEGDPMIACGSGFLRLLDVSLNGLSNEAAKATINRSVRLRLS